MRRLGPLLGLIAASLMGACGEPSTPSRIVILGLDGVDPDVVASLVAEGRLPNFERLQTDGSTARLTSSPPLLSPIIWTTIATGREPVDHGIAHFTVEDPVTGETIPITSTLRRTKALWNIFSESQRTVSVVGWWATWPAETVAGQMLSDRLGYHFLMEDQDLRLDATSGVTYPPEALVSNQALMRSPADIGAGELARFVDIDPHELAQEPDFADDLGHFRWALATAGSYVDIGLSSWRQLKPDLLMVYIEGVDTSSHLFGHLYRQTELSGELATQQARFGNTVEEMYVYADEIVGRFLEALDESSTLVVVSDHGFKLGELHSDLSATRDLRRVSEAFHREEGILYLYGRGVRPGSTIRKAHILDVTPTALALAGLPVSAEMPGRVLQEALVPLEVQEIASYEPSDPEGDEGGGARDRTAADEAIMKRLESLGYVGSSSTSNDRNLASLLLQEGRYDEAAKAFQAFVDRDPHDVAALSSLGASLAGLGRSQEALQYLDAALKLEPDNPMTLGTRGLVLERLGDRDGAIDQYRQALRYDPEHRPSIQALARLGVGVTGRIASTAAERRVVEILSQVEDLVKKGDLRGARQHLEEAQALTPDEAIVYQYLANVAYLSGDHDAAVDALERGLVLEPDNQQMRTNLRRQPLEIINMHDTCDIRSFRARNWGVN